MIQAAGCGLPGHFIVFGVDAESTNISHTTYPPLDKVRTSIVSTVLKHRPQTPAKTYCVHSPRHGRARARSGALRLSSNARACRLSSNSFSAGKVDSRVALGSTQATFPRLCPMVGSAESCPVSAKRTQSSRNTGSHSSAHMNLSLRKHTEG